MPDIGRDDTTPHSREKGRWLLALHEAAHAAAVEFFGRPWRVTYITDTTGGMIYHDDSLIEGERRIVAAAGGQAERLLADVPPPERSPSPVEPVVAVEHLPAVCYFHRPAVSDAEVIGYDLGELCASLCGANVVIREFRDRILQLAERLYLSGVIVCETGAEGIVKAKGTTRPVSPPVPNLTNSEICTKFVLAGNGYCRVTMPTGEAG